MTTVLESPVEIEKTPAPKEAQVVDGDALIKDAIAKIKWRQSGIGQSNLERIIHFFGIGDELNDLHTQIQRGKWEARVKEATEINKTTALRLRSLASSPLRILIMTNGQDLKDKLSSDIQKLVTLAKLSDTKIGEFFERFNPSKMSRTKLRAVVDEICEKSKSKDGKSKKKRSKSSTSQKDEATESTALPIEQLFTICGQSMFELTDSVQEQLDSGKVEQDSIEKAAVAVDNALECLNKLRKAIREKLAA